MDWVDEMISASREFLSSIEPPLSEDGALDRSHMQVSALQAALRQFMTSPGHAMYDHHPLPDYWIASIVSDPDNAEWIKDEASRKIAEGMPFVGWSIDADNRRVSGCAQPGEGEFIKYLGRSV